MTKQRINNSQAFFPPSIPNQGLSLGGKRRIAHVSIDDPNPALRGRKQIAAANICDDILRREYERGLISKSAFDAGRRYQKAIERSISSISCGTPFDIAIGGLDASRVEAGVVAKMDRAKNALNHRKSVIKLIGAFDAAIFEKIIINGDILRSGQNPKILWIDDAKIVGD